MANYYTKRIEPLLRSALVAVFLTVPAAAQQAEIDSLTTLLQTEMPDSTRARLKLDFAYASMFSDPESGRLAALEGLATARRLGLDELRSRAYTLLAGSYWALSDPDPGLVFADSALALARELGHRGLEAFALNAMNVLLGEKGDLPGALEVGYQIIEIAREIGDQRREAILLFNRSETYFRLQDYDNAVQAATESLDLLETIDPNTGPALKAGVLSLLGETNVRRGNLAEAGRLLEEGIALYDEVGGQETYLPEALVPLATVRLSEGRSEEARALLTRATAISQELGDPGNSAKSWSGWSDYYAKKGDSGEAARAAERALEFAEMIPDAEYIHDNLWRLYRLTSERGEIDRAFAYLQRYVAYEDSLRDEDQVRAVQRIELARREGDLMAERRALVAQEQARRRRLYAGLGILALFLLFGLLYALRLRQKNAKITRQAAEIQQQKENVELLSTVGREITSSLRLDAIIETAYSRVNGLMDAAVFGIGLHDETKNALRFAGTRETGETLPDHEDDLDDPTRLAALCFKRQEEIVIGDLRNEHARYIPEVPAVTEGGTPDSVIYLPLTHQAKRLGVLTVQSFEKGAYGDYELNILRNVATYVALALENAEAYRQNEQLLLNILPGAIANRLKAGEETIADAFGEVTVLFADLVGFTAFASTTNADRVVFLLNELFSAFDALTVQLGIEKIKTIGDAYLAVAGLPGRREDHAEVVAVFALEMQQTLGAFNLKHGLDLGLRIGMNTGPVVAGVIGTHKFVYDLWGDAVNVAARMESHGIPGRVQCSQSTYDALRDRFTFEERGAIEMKGKGRMEAYLLNDRREERSAA